MGNVARMGKLGSGLLPAVGGRRGTRPAKGFSYDARPLLPPRPPFFDTLRLPLGCRWPHECDVLQLPTLSLPSPIHDAAKSSTPSSI